MGRNRFRKRIPAFLVSLLLLCASLFIVSSAGNDRNGRITDAPTPTGAGTEKYVRSFGTDYANAPTSPILAEDTLLIFSGWKLYKLNKDTGEEIASVKAEGRITFTTVSPLYYDGTVFMQLDNGIVQAFDFETMKSLWIYHNPDGGQALCPIRYDDGCIYTGFWNGETNEADYVCLNADDPDTTQELEEKTAQWTYSAPGGFYRAGCAFSDRFVVFGKDDGARGTGEDSVITVLDKKTGRFVSSLSVVGDIRTDVVYDAENDAYYTASKSGYVYRFLMDRTTGALSDLTVFDASGSVTSAPVVYKNRMYIGVQNGMEGRFLVLDAASLREIYSDDLPGYPQAGMLVSTGYENASGKVYVYTTYNRKPGGIFVFEDSAGQTSAIKNEVYVPPEHASQFCISQIVCDDEGTLYYKNDSGNIFAVASSGESGVPERIIAFLRSVLEYVYSLFARFGTVF